MLYFLQGTEDYFIHQETERIAKEAASTREDILHFSALEVPFTTIMLEMASADIFAATKIILLKDLEQTNMATYFGNTNEQEWTVTQESPNILLLRYYQDTKLSKTVETTLAPLLTKAIHLNTMKQNEQDTIQFIKHMLRQYNYVLTTNQLQQIAETYQNNLALIKNELERIILGKKKNEQIQFGDFNLNSTFLEEQVFDLIQMLEKKNVTRVFQKLDNMLLQQQNVFGMLALLLKNYKEMYQIKALTAVHYTQDQIATRLGIHPYRTKLLKTTANTIKQEYFPLILDKIITTEIDLKRGKDQGIALKELFVYLIQYIK